MARSTSDSCIFSGCTAEDSSPHLPSSIKLSGYSTGTDSSLYRSTSVIFSGSSTASSLCRSGLIKAKGSSVANFTAGRPERKVKQPSLAEDNPGFWADYIRREENIRNKWERDYGHKFYGNQHDLQSSGRELDGECCQNVLHGHITGNGNGRLYDYLATGNTSKRHTEKDHAALYNFGHHTEQFDGVAKPLTSDNDLYLQIQRSSHNNSAPCTEPPICLGKPCNAPSGLDKCGWIPFTRDGRVDLDKMAWKCDCCSYPELQRHLYEVPMPEVRPKCCNSLGHTCVPRSCEKIPEDHCNGQAEEHPLCAPQVWCGPSYAGSRRSGPGDLLQPCYRLSSDPDKETPMNRVYDEFRANNYYGATPHSGEDTNICIGCCRAREAARGTWFDEQLRKGNPFTTGDTQFKSSAYIQKP